MIFSSSAFYTDINYCEAGEQLEPILDCRKRLLEAGCDPTLPILTYSEPDVELFEAFLDVAVPVCLIRQIVLYVPKFSFLLTRYAGSNTNSVGFRQQLCQRKHQKHLGWIVRICDGLL